MPSNSHPPPFREAKWSKSSDQEITVPACIIWLSRAGIPAARPACRVRVKYVAVYGNKRLKIARGQR